MGLPGRGGVGREGERETERGTGRRNTGTCLILPTHLEQVRYAMLRRDN